MGKLKERTARKYKPKRKFHGNRHTLGRILSDLNEDSSAPSPVVVEDEEPGLSSSSSQSTLTSSITTTNATTESSDPPLLSASASKINPLLEEDVASNDDEDGLSGFRLMDISILSDIIRKLPCPDCIVNDLILIGQKSKNGFASEFTLKCSASRGYEKDFSSSKKCGKGYEVNRRIVYSMRQVGVGYAGISKSCGILPRGSR